MWGWLLFNTKVAVSRNHSHSKPSVNRFLSSALIALSWLSIRSLLLPLSVNWARDYPLNQFSSWISNRSARSTIDQQVELIDCMSDDTCLSRCNMRIQFLATCHHYFPLRAGIRGCINSVAEIPGNRLRITRGLCGVSGIVEQIAARASFNDRPCNTRRSSPFAFSSGLRIPLSITNCKLINT